MSRVTRFQEGGRDIGIRGGVVRIESDLGISFRFKFESNLVSEIHPSLSLSPNVFGTER